MSNTSQLGHMPLTLYAQLPLLMLLNLFFNLIAVRTEKLGFFVSPLTICDCPSKNRPSLHHKIIKYFFCPGDSYIQ